MNKSVKFYLFVNLLHGVLQTSSDSDLQSVQVPRFQQRYRIDIGRRAQKCGWEYGVDDVRVFGARTQKHLFCYRITGPGRFLGLMWSTAQNHCQLLGATCCYNSTTPPTPVSTKYTLYTLSQDHIKVITVNRLKDRHDIFAMSNFNKETIFFGLRGNRV